MKKETEQWLNIAFEDYEATECLFEKIYLQENQLARMPKRH